ncbi:MAG: hypothetical protein ACLSHG_00470 [Oscillospiraceae bacterium]
MTTVEAAVRQYGGYIQMSDLLLLTAIDNNLTMATKLLGAQAGRTLDTITREVLVGGDNVQYADESVSARYLPAGRQRQRRRQQLPDRSTASAAPCARSKTPTAAASTARSRSSSTPTWPMTS